MAVLVKRGNSFKGIITIKKSSLTDKGSTSQWRRLRVMVLKRDGYSCQICGMEATHVDHIIPRRLMAGEAVDSMDNLQSLCRNCNLKKGGSFLESDRTPMTPRDLSVSYTHLTLPTKRIV